MMRFGSNLNILLEATRRAFSDLNMTGGRELNQRHPLEALGSRKGYLNLAIGQTNVI
jgi:hypothetical protein